MENKPPRAAHQKASAVLTRQAYERLRQELEHLTGEGRDKMAERLLAARELGDLRENAEYDSAKNDQGMMEARIREIQALLKDPDVVEGPLADSDEAGAGMLVTVHPIDEDDSEDEVYLLAASKEERAEGARTVSVTSPFGAALLGKKVGDKVEYEAPGGTFSYELVSLQPHQ